VELVVRPIGFVRSPFGEKVEAPRQAVARGGKDVEGRVELLPEYEHALADLDGFDRIWILFWFHRAHGWNAKVLPPRSEGKRGLFATRSPHRPNPIGMSCVRLVRASGLVLHVRDLDVVDGTPVIDIKPYIAYADAFPGASTGWLEAPRDPREAWEVRFAPLAEAQLAWIAAESGFDLRARVAEALALGPSPHPYRRIKKLDEGASLLAAKEWRARFTTEGRTITVDRIASGYRPKELATGEGAILDLHRAFAARFG
jgi:tRNA-Thr(GGU) m(6)t(6)A37 methyltransferase TsaA